ncbi:MAG TPA: ABC transporter ATP-binding protein [Candidatus Kryptonia bacterium]|nr:ABC transporter ATP-binding protein [Candidatus Kryptonia bacterium]
MLSLSGINKRFGDVQALANVSLDFRAGEIHALLGENGAGKSTLMHVLAGLYRPDGGAIRLDGATVRFTSPLAARRAGIGMVHQHFTLVEPLTVAENLVMCSPQRPRFRLSRRRAVRHAVELAARAGLDLGDPQAISATLPVGLRQRVEILKALAGDTRILILDEPTAVLTREESLQLFTLLRRLREDGRLILFITHKLREVAEVADRVTVMRRGHVVATVDVASISEGAMAELMIGAAAPQRHPRSAVAADAPELLRVDAVSTAADGGCRLQAASCTIRAGEILGIAGVAGNGQQELFEVLIGLRAAAGGRIEIAGKCLDNSTPAAAAGAGIGHIPPDRHHDALVLPMSVAENAILNRGVLARLRRGMWLPNAAVRQFAAEIVQRHLVQTDTLDTPVSSLSGGNQQRLIVGRQLAPQPRVLVAVNPTRGLDIAAAHAVHDALDTFVAAGRGVLLISADLDEVLDLSHRVAVLYAGRLSTALTPPVLPETIGRLMAGATQ